MTVKDLWDSFAATVIPPTAPEVQYGEMRRAFYAGCYGMLGALAKSADDYPDTPAGEQAGVDYLDGLRRELEQFSADVQAGRA
jgi:hypothetical protein